MYSFFISYEKKDRFGGQFFVLIGSISFEKNDLHDCS